MPADLPLLLLGGFFAAFASGLAGFAFALIASAAWYQVLTPAEAAPLVVAGSLIIQSITLWSLRGMVRWRLLWPMLAGGVPGVPLGTWLLGRLDGRVLSMGVGLLMVAYASFMLTRLALGRMPLSIGRGGRLADGAIGFGGGVLGGLGGFSGVLPTIWCDLRGWPKDLSRGVYQSFILAIQLWAAVMLAIGGFFDGRTGALLLPLTPALLLGAWTGLRLYRAASAERFRLVLLVLLLVSGVSLLV